MRDDQPWAANYFEEIFLEPDPWRYFVSPYERNKYQRQIEIIKYHQPEPERILEIGSAEGALTILLAEQFKGASITAVEISSQAMKRARENLKPYLDRTELINDDVAKCEPMLKDRSYDVCVWSESIYYLGAKLPVTETFDLLARIIGKLKDGGLLVSANVVDLPEEVPESRLTRRPLIDCYCQMLSGLALPISKTIYHEKKGTVVYEYQIWAFAAPAPGLH